jgi:spore protease
MQIKVNVIVKNSNGDDKLREIDLKNFEIRTDLICDSVGLDNVKKEVLKNIFVSEIELDSKKAKELDKKCGKYTTIEFEDVTDTTNFNNVKNILKKSLKKFINNEKTLLIGLGNSKSTPDILGPKVADEIIVTSYLEEFGPLEEGFSSVAIFKPGVKGETGIETASIIKSIVDDFKPKQVIVIDALASKSLARVCKTIQISDTGISPGSGVGNKRVELSKDTLGVPVVAIGIPTVVDAAQVVTDTINYLMKQYTFQKKFLQTKKSRLVLSTNINYLKEKIEPSKEDKEKVLGMLGTLEEDEIKTLFKEVLTPIGYNLMVTPKEIDFTISKLSHLLANALNEILHPKLSE